MSDQKPVEQVPAAEPEKLQEAAVVASEAPEASDKPSETPAAATTETTDKEAEPKAEEAVHDTPAKVEEPVNDAPVAPEPEAAKPEEQKPEQPAYLTKIPGLAQLFEQLPKILNETSYNEMWGVQLKDSEDVPTVNVLIKFLRANEGNVQGAQDQLRKALEWRKKTDPLALVESGRYSATKYGGLGYLTTYEQDGRPLVFTWNIYGAVKDVSATFGDSDEFVKWRAALMELAVQDLKMKDATEVIDYDGEKDPYQMIQVHDYLNVKFLRMDPAVRAATKKTIDVFSTAYPELLREKFFVNVPTIMGWMFSAMKLFLSRNTTRKFHPISNGANLAREFPAAIADKIPKTYGGKGAELKDEARTVQLVEDKVEKEDKKDEAKPVEATEETAAPADEKPVTEEAPKEEAAKEETAKEEPVKAEAPKEEPVKEEVHVQVGATNTEQTTEKEVLKEEIKPVAEEAK
ncbi:Phosphatidylinositol transfer protein sfh5 [Penicillium cataractarum]|uniref:Phosphatidylinositol transfer protein SFH5 n=1 Tax=Penicillium cataractarum TaxID=2100454 RepID=A0A9W9SS78_9EURO|nr:Phosphatidylinositol transfer protein sfh5 [Penicillium cataractarum]KAJ5381493.1 Phosphatidylinositol transfer protein sfh5 [Penicillium cataractarum]